MEKWIIEIWRARDRIWTRLFCV